MKLVPLLGGVDDFDWLALGLRRHAELQGFEARSEKKKSIKTPRARNFFSSWNSQYFHSYEEARTVKRLPLTSHSQMVFSFCSESCSSPALTSVGSWAAEQLPTSVNPARALHEWKKWKRVKVCFFHIQAGWAGVWQSVEVALSFYEWKNKARTMLGSCLAGGRTCAWRVTDSHWRKRVQADTSEAGPTNKECFLREFRPLPRSWHPSRRLVFKMNFLWKMIFLSISHSVSKHKNQIHLNTISLISNLKDFQR